MFFQNLSKEKQQAIKDLCKDKEFQKRFAEDQVLDDLDTQKYDYSQAKSELLATIGNTFQVDGIKFKHLTPTVWAVLWMTKNPFVKMGDNELKAKDLDEFIFFLNNGISSDPIAEQLKQADGFLQRNEISFDTAAKVIHKVIRDAFSPLSMFPATQAEGKVLIGKAEVIYDADWMTSLCAKVADVTRKTC